MHLRKIPLLCLGSLKMPGGLASAASPLGVFDFDLRGKTPAEKIHSTNGTGFSGITMFLSNDSDLKRLSGYVAARPDLRRHRRGAAAHQGSSPSAAQAAG